MFKKCAVCSLRAAVFHLGPERQTSCQDGPDARAEPTQHHGLTLVLTCRICFTLGSSKGPAAGSTNTLWTGDKKIFSHVGISFKSVRRILFVQVAVRCRDTLRSEKTWTAKPNKISDSSRKIHFFLFLIERSCRIILCLCMESVGPQKQFFCFSLSLLLSESWSYLCKDVCV